MKWIKRFLVLALVVLVVLQFFRPERNESPDGYANVTAFMQETKPVAEVKAILEGSCFDCHSNHTTYPWYANIAPVSYWLADHVEDGKKHLDFSKWSEYSLKRKDHKLDELIEEVEEGEMPLNSYTWTHEEANLTPEQIQAMITWAKAVRTTYDLKAIPQ